MAASIWNPGSANSGLTANGTGVVIETSTLLDGQTLIPILTFQYKQNSASLQVYLNGVLLTKSDYVETSVASITLLESAVQDDVIQFIGVIAQSTLSQPYAVQPEQSIASAITCNVGALQSSFVVITGTTTISSFGTIYRGPIFIRFEHSLTLGNNAALSLPGNAPIITQSGDTLILIPKATNEISDGWVVYNYQRKSIAP
jgi:hypothetical protein